MTTQTMRAAVFTGAQRLHVVSLALPEPGPHDIRIRLEGCGVCASNLPVWEGRPWFAYPFEPGAPGHEGWGRIDALGRDVRGLALGQRVAVLSVHAYATYDTAPAEAVVPLPASLEGVPFPGEALGCHRVIGEDERRVIVFTPSCRKLSLLEQQIAHLHVMPRLALGIVRAGRIGGHAHQL